MSTSDEPKNKGDDNEVCNSTAEKVHSANSWEKVDLGDDDRKKKFLKLMGATKTEHHGRFVIGEKELPAHSHGRDKTDTENINQELEHQFKHTMEHRVTKFSHKGLGFDSEEPPVKEASVSDGGDVRKSVEEKDNSDNSGEGNSSKVSKTGDSAEPPPSDGSKKRESTDKPAATESPPKKPKMMMNFVKASD